MELDIAKVYVSDYGFDFVVSDCTKFLRLSDTDFQTILDEFMAEHIFKEEFKAGTFPVVFLKTFYSNKPLCKKILLKIWDLES